MSQSRLDPGFTRVNDATFLLQMPATGVSNAQALSALASGYLKNTTITGVVSSQAVPIPSADGGTNKTSFATTNATTFFDGTQLTGTTTSGVTGEVLHGNTSAAPTFSPVSLTVDVSGILPVGNGGTGVASATNHGVMVGSGASATTATAAGTSGTVLTGSTGATPVFSAVDLATNTVTNSLPFANGGTARTGNVTAGSVIFSDGSQFQQDNSNFFYDDTNNSLLIGGTTIANAEQELAFDGSATFNEQSANGVTFRVEGDTATKAFTANETADNVGFGTTVTQGLAKWSATESAFNDNAANIDFRTEGQTKTRLLGTSALLDRVAIRNAGLKTPDASGFARDGAVIGGVAPTFSGSGMALDGVDRDDDSSGVNCGVTGFGVSTSDGSMQVKATINLTSVSGTQVFAGKGDGSSEGYLLYMAGGLVTFTVINNLGSAINAIGTTAIAANTTYNIEGNWTGAVLNVKVGGVQEGTTPAITALQPPNGTVPFAIGRYSTFPGFGPFPAVGTISAVSMTRGGVLQGSWALTSTTEATVPVSTFDNSNGGVIVAVAAKSANYTLTGNDYAITATGGTVGITITCPSAAGGPRKFFVKKVDAGAGIVTVAPAAAQTIDGSAVGVLLVAQWSGTWIQSDGVSNWMILK